MNVAFEYSVVIRTLGTSGEKYARLIKSIENQTIRPKEVLIVLPYEFTLPHILRDDQRVIFTQKGMVNQRQVGIEEAVSQFLLIVDDDIAFEKNFVEELFKKMLSCDADAISPNGGIDTNKKLYGVSYWKYFLLGQRRYSRKISPYYLRVSRTGGTIVNIRMKEGDLHWCQTANFQCFFIKRNAAVNVHFENEKWLEDTGYALPDDQVFFYKLYLNGGKILFAPEIRYTHLDAKSGNIKSDKLYKDYYTAQRNYTIFWCRFLYAKAKN